ncbi:outer membrane protein [Sphingomonas sp. LHG3406-1]|uniref:outer membrane protein n=1 Tax=Sphingomonas sp. LHG3406-1 TaxID=2804617 RepID=UPI002614E29A|nr:porin family protein [Sphingomonas sp. LHG3406-1]
MNKLLALTAVATAALAATPALAQAPQGPRVEGLVGYDAVRVDLSDVGIDDKFKDEGVLYGVGVGYDFALGNGVSLGADLEASDSTAKESNIGGTLKAKRDLYAGGRVSFPLGADGSNVYVKGGYTNARFSASDGTISATDNVDGYRLGGGAQFAVRGKAYVGGEYRYSNYEGGLERHQLAATIGTRF